MKKKKENSFKYKIQWIAIRSLLKGQGKIVPRELPY